MKKEEVTNNIFVGDDPGSAMEYIKGYLNGGRIIPILGTINEKMVSQISIAMLVMECNEVAPITLLMHTDGGSDGFVLENVINSLRSPVDCLVYGKACSMGGIILQLCRKRMMLPQSEIYCHYPTCTYTFHGDFRTTNDSYYKWMYEQSKFAHERQVNLFSKRTGKTKEEVEQFFHIGDLHKHFIGADQALQFGLIDEIVPDFKIFHESFKGRKVSEKKKKSAD